ncbi:MAG: DUF4176 domain-containing protein [Oscillospiraceae bacterium]|nr:DUF4176 domain-containing protein [Oscillospiraceae bacterium]
MQIKKLLPIGSVVLLKDGQKRLMIFGIQGALPLAPFLGEQKRNPSGARTPKILSSTFSKSQTSKNSTKTHPKPRPNVESNDYLQKPQNRLEYQQGVAQPVSRQATTVGG